VGEKKGVEADIVSKKKRQVTGPAEAKGREKEKERKSEEKNKSTTDQSCIGVKNRKR
jgi:hypothetical protein